MRTNEARNGLAVRAQLLGREARVQWLCAVVVLRRSLIVERLRLEAAWHDEVDAAGQSQWARIGVVKRKHVLQTRRDCRENALARGIRIEDWKAQAVSLQVRQQRAKEAVIVRSPSGAGGSALGVSAWVCMSRRGILGGRQHFDVAAKHVSQNADCRLAQILVVEDGAGARKLRRPKALDSRVPDW